jgi:hypothetical protein
MGITTKQDQETVQGRGPRTVGGGGMGTIGTRARTEKLVHVIWETTTQHEAYVPAAAWDRMGGVLGDTTDSGVEGYLSDVERDEREPDVIERSVRSVEHGYEP